MAASASSEATAAILDKVSPIRRDPFAMSPFCGYNMGDYFQHWFEMGDRLGEKAPRIFYVNWFRKGEGGRWLWPGFGENSRVLKWMCERVDGKAGARETPVGPMPGVGDLDLDGLSIPSEDLNQLLKIDPQSWQGEILDIEAYFEQFGSHFTDRLRTQLDALKERLAQA
jgi:phosphoenolpyruvate carboxykinase (GTP)